MLKILKLSFAEGNQTLDVSNGTKVVASLYADLQGTVLLVDVPDAVPTEPAATGAETEVVNV